MMWSSSASTIAFARSSRSDGSCGSPAHPSEPRRPRAQAIAEAARMSKPLNVCFSLLYTAPVFLWCGDYTSANDVLERLTAHPNWRALPAFHATTLALKGELRGAPRRARTGHRIADPALAALRAARQTVLRARAASTLVEGLAAAGRVDEARSVVDDAIAELPAGEDPLELLRAAAHQGVRPARDAQARRSGGRAMPHAIARLRAAANRPRAGSCARPWRSLDFARSAAQAGTRVKRSRPSTIASLKVTTRSTSKRRSSCSSPSPPSSRQTRQELLRGIADADNAERCSQPRLRAQRRVVACRSEHVVSPRPLRHRLYPIQVAAKRVKKGARGSPTLTRADGLAVAAGINTKGSTP